MVDAYIKQCKRGRALPDGFKDDIVGWLDDLNKLQNLKPWGKPRTKRYWSVPAYARAHQLRGPALMKRLRELEKIAIQLFRDDVPAGRRPRGPLSEEEKAEIRRLFLDGIDAAEIAKRFRISGAKVGYLCREQKKARFAERDRLIDEHMAQTTSKAPIHPAESESPF